MRASVIVPTRNRAMLLQSALRSLEHQSVSNDEFEVIVVDNGSTDATPEVCREFARRLQLVYLRETEPGLHAGRHAGMLAARTDLLMFADDDIQAGEAWVETVVRAFEDPSVGLVGGNNLPDFESPPPSWLERWWQREDGTRRFIGHLSILDFGQGRFEIDPGFVWGCNFSIRRGLLLEAGGFHPDALPEHLLAFRGDGETHVSNHVRRSGFRAMFDAGAMVQHRVSTDRMSAAYFSRRSFAEGISASYADIRGNGGLKASTGRAFLTRLRALGGSLTAGVRAVNPAADAVSRTLESIRANCARAFGEGYAFHRNEVRRNPELLTWVLKPGYLP